jgi:hypothetical protein
MGCELPLLLSSFDRPGLLSDTSTLLLDLFKMNGLRELRVAY